MKLPRDVSGADLADRLGRLGYAITRQTGSHLRLTTSEHDQHHVTIPNHDRSKWERWPEFLTTWLRILKSAARN